MYTGRKIQLNFQEFYYTLLHQFKIACIQSQPAEGEVEKTVEEIQAPILECLKTQLKNGSENLPQEQKQDIAQGIYLSAALGDEIYLNHEWFGREIWKKNMLEHQIFQTQNAGDRVPQAIDEIVQKPQNYPSALLEIYFLLLVLGFKGRFTESQISAYKKRILAILFPLAQFLFDQRQTELMPGNMNSVISSANSHHFFDTRRWIHFMTGFFIIFTIITTYFWYAYHKDIGIIIRQLDSKTFNIRSF